MQSIVLSAFDERILCAYSHRQIRGFILQQIPTFRYKDFPDVFSKFVRYEKRFF
ncbi:MAG: hypothetical protein KatS3mg028_0771 [Bacteroidia bacterium]|nr:MAG: hypothetical protein KatS3mg028_0771 [Bacteroidia bacterium]